VKNNRKIVRGLSLGRLGLEYLERFVNVLGKVLKLSTWRY